MGGRSENGFHFCERVVFPWKSNSRYHSTVMSLLLKFRAPSVKPPGFSLPELMFSPLKLSICSSCGVKESVLLLCSLKGN